MDFRYSRTECSNRNVSINWINIAAVGRYEATTQRRLRKNETQLLITWTQQIGHFFGRQHS